MILDKLSNVARTMFESTVLGVIAAICSAVFMAAQRITSRRGMVGEKSVSPTIGVFITMVVALGYFGLLIIGFGKAGELFNVDRLTLISLGVAGIIHFVIGRTFSYHAFKYIGVNAASPYIAMNSFYAIVFSALFLSERPSVVSLLGACVILSGVLIITIFKPRLTSSDPVQQHQFRKGILCGVGAGLSFGSSAPLIRLGLKSGGTPIVGPFVSYLFALLVYVPIILLTENVNELKQLKLADVKYFFSSGLLVNTAHLARYFALSFIPVSIAMPLLSSNEVFSILFSRLLIKKYELFKRPIIVGVILTIIGVFIVALENIG